MIGKKIAHTTFTFFSKLSKMGNFLPKFHNLFLKHYLWLALIHIVLIVLFTLMGIKPLKGATQDLVSPLTPLKPLAESKKGYEVMGFAPYWTFDKLDNVDFGTLSTMAYFGVNALGDGTLDKYDVGYTTFKSKEATRIFKKAHSNGTRVVLTLTQMNNGPILALLDNPESQAVLIEEASEEVQKRGIDGINLDFEYGGNPGEEYQQKYAQFVKDLTIKMHNKNPNSKVTVSVYAASVKEPKLYDIAALSRASDGIFMMAYDYAVTGSDHAIPTSPLYGYKEGKYWYDVSTAVDDFLTKMPADKLILGVPWYGYNYLVYQPEVKAETRPSWTWRGSPTAQTYAIAVDNIHPNMEGILDYKTGWDEVGKVGWIAYLKADTNTWRMIFLEDPRSLGLKYDFAKEKNLKGVGIWALGFEEQKRELWDVIKDKFGLKIADQSLVGKVIASEDEEG